MTALPEQASAVAWVGRAPPPGQSCTHAATLEFALGLSPAPELLVIDPVDTEGWRAWLAQAQPSLAQLGLVVVVPEVTREIAASAIAAGVLCCLPRACLGGGCAAMIAAAVQLQRQRQPVLSPARALRPGGPTLLQASWSLRSPEQAEALASLMAAFCPAPERRIGGLLELLINAIEHGNLEITGPGKQALLAEGRWYEELLLRLKDPRWSQRTVRVTFERAPSGLITVSIEDDGEGFDVEAVLAYQLAHNDSRNGRGIALARLMSFDELRWEGRGNRVVGRIYP